MMLIRMDREVAGVAAQFAALAARLDPDDVPASYAPALWSRLDQLGRQVAADPDPEGCGRTITQIDHRLPWASTRHTTLDELDQLCGHHHDNKTYDGWALTNGTGKRPFVPPHDPRHPRHARDDQPPLHAA